MNILMHGLYKIISVDFYHDLTLTLAKNWMNHQTLRGSMDGDFTGFQRPRIHGIPYHQPTKFSWDFHGLVYLTNKNED